ncbi:MAG: carboxypeptidase-like regulatory domain-containing protein [Longimonas sp.]|uniref:carboxypeptidase-like regulatory domain-containing protein n=1 Tax=Longimonas sp. TaxID=2039626 RepID=UPI00335871DE
MTTRTQAQNVLRMALCALCVLAACVAVCYPADAQQPDAPTPAVFQGTVVHAETGEPLPGVHVFLAGTTTGAATDRNGTFSFTTRARGAHRLYVSMVGFEPEQRDLVLRSGARHTLHLQLAPSTVALDAITVEAERTRSWRRSLQRFEELFIGTSEYADAVTLLNPEVLRFSRSWWGPFQAHASAPLVIENRALGYRIRYHLDEFESRGSILRWDGEPFFELLTPSSEQEAERWRQRREEAFRGSFRHFMLALLYDRVSEEGFAMHRVRLSHMNRAPHSQPQFRAQATRIVEPTEDSTFTVRFRGRLVVRYHEAPESQAFVAWRGGTPRRPRSYQPSQVELNRRPVEVDRWGKSLEPYAMTVYGAFAFRRIADLVPLGYLPDAYGADSPFPRRTDLYVSGAPLEPDE